MASKMTSQPVTVDTSTHNNGNSFDLALSPSEPGKFDFYRVHLNQHAPNNHSTFSETHDASDSSVEIPARWSPFANMKHLDDQAKTSSSSALYPLKTGSSADTDSLSKLNKPIKTVASFSTLTDAVKNAMQRGYLNTPTNQLRQQANGTTLSSKELNHLSPQSM